MTCEGGGSKVVECVREVAGDVHTHSNAGLLVARDLVSALALLPKALFFRLHGQPDHFSPVNEEA